MPKTEKQKAYAKAWRAAHPEYGPTYRKANREKLRAYNRASYLKNREKEIAYGKMYRETHGEEIRRYSRTPRGRFLKLKLAAKQREITTSLTLEDYIGLTESGRCCYCKGPLPETGSGLDRRDSSGDYSVENCVPCCAACNSIRGKDLITHEEMFKVVKFIQRLRRKNAA